MKREALKMEEEEESEGEIVEGRPQPPVRVPEPLSKAQSKASPPVQRVPPARAKPGLKVTPTATSAPRPRPSQAVQPPATKSAARAQGSGLSANVPPIPAAAPSKKREYAPDVEEETLEFGRPSRPLPTKRSRPSPPPEKPFSLALPGSSSSAGLAPALPSSSSAPAALSFPGSSSAAVSLPSAAPAAAVLVDDSDNEDWDEVEPAASASTTPPTAVPMPTRTIEMEEIEPSTVRVEEEEEEEIDMNAFEELLNEAVGGDAPEPEAAIDDEEDFLAAAVSPVADRAPGGVDWGDEDDYSSSDESDED